jgi:hypothetical protein
MSVAPRGLRGDSPAQRYAKREPQGWLPHGHIDGFTLSNDGTDSTNDIGIAAGVCRSTSNVGPDGIRTTLPKYQADLEIPVAIIKQLDVAWAPENYDPENGIGGGARSGMRSSSSISNTTWHIFAIGGFDCPTDIMAHDGVDPSAVLPNGYTAWRRIGSILRESAAIAGFVQLGDRFDRATMIADVTAATPGSSAVTRTLSVPTGISVVAYVSVSMTSAGNTETWLITPLDCTDTAPTTDLCDCVTPQTSGAISVTKKYVRTNTSAQVRSRAGTANAVTGRIATIGWIDTRGRN